MTTQQHLTMTVDDAVLDGDLFIPEHPQPETGLAALIMFAHGGGSDRNSPRNRYVATVMQDKGFATFLFDLLTADEKIQDTATAEYRFDIGLLRQRLTGVTEWLLLNIPSMRDISIGYFGASTGAAAAIRAAVQGPQNVRAIVSRGGRPDLAGDDLTRVNIPALFIVGGKDRAVLDLNKSAIALYRGESNLAVIPEAGHLFEEPGALEEVARLSGEWFSTYLLPRVVHA